MYQRTRIQTHHCQTHHQTNLILPVTENKENLKSIANLIRPMTAKTENLKARDAIKRKSVGNSQNMNFQNYCQATLICPTKVIIKSIDPIIKISIVNSTLSNYAQN